MAAIAAAILAVCKAVPAAERIAGMFVQLYVTWKTQKNAADEKDTNTRNDDAVDRAVAAQPKLCDTCPFRPFAGDAPRLDG